MAIDAYGVDSSENDGITGYNANINLDILSSFYNNGIIPSQISIAFANLDTSTIGTDSILAATLYWYHVAYSKTKNATNNRRITIDTSVVYTDTALLPAVGWTSHDLESAELSLINKTGLTVVKFYVDNPGSTYYREWDIQAWDYIPTGSRSVYLSITHAAAGGPTIVSIIKA